MLKFKQCILPISLCGSSLRNTPRIVEHLLGKTTRINLVWVDTVNRYYPWWSPDYSNVQWGKIPAQELIKIYTHPQVHVTGWDYWRRHPNFKEHKELIEDLFAHAPDAPQHDCEKYLERLLRRGDFKRLLPDLTPQEAYKKCMKPAMEFIKEECVVASIWDSENLGPIVYRGSCPQSIKLLYDELYPFLGRPLYRLRY